MVAITSTGGGADADLAYGPPGWQGIIKAPFVFGLAVFASMGGVLFGYDQGVVSGVLVMSNFKKTFPELEDPTLEGWMVSVLTLGALFGALANGPVSDALSRRWSILLASVIFVAGSAVQAGSSTIGQMFAGRAVAGVSIGMLSMVVPMYISELSPPELRGGLVALQQLAITFGIMFSFWLDYGTNYIGGTGDSQSEASWRFPMALQILPALVLGAGTSFLPYSPRWLMLKDREDEARQTLARVRRVPLDDWRLDREILEMRAASLFEKEVQAERAAAATAQSSSGNNQQPPSRLRVMAAQYAELFAAPHLRRRLVVACLLQVIQQFTGINAIIYYAPSIFEQIGLSGDSVSLLATGVVGVINFVSTLPAIMYLDRWGRRTVLLAGGVGMGAAQLIVGALYASFERSWAAREASGAGWAAAVFVWLYIACFAFSIGCVNWVIPSELFPPAHRGKAVGVAIATNWLSNFIVGLITPRMLASIRFGTFFFFCAFCVILILWVAFFLPETRGVRIEEMDKLFGGNDGQADAQRMGAIRLRLGLDVPPAVIAEKNAGVSEAQVEHAQ